MTSLESHTSPFNRYNHFIKELGIVDAEIENKIITYISHGQHNFEPSKLYSTATQSLTIDTDIRSSNFQLIIQPQLFDLIDLLIQKINGLDQFYNYLLVRNDVTHIKYKEGDFFKAHEDYLSLTSNTVEEYTMIMCLGVTPLERTGNEGGETIFQINQFFRHISKESVTPGHCLIFRKDINHEGALLKCGTKEILTFNLWGIPKESGKICIISFPDSDFKYVIPYNKILEMNSFLRSKFNFDEKNAKLGCIISYVESEFTYEQFEIIYKILMNMYVDMEMLEKSMHIVTQYGIDLGDILLVINPAESLKIDKRRTEISLNDNVIICPTEEEALHLNELIKEYKLPYVLFKTMFVEGTTSYGGGMSDTDPLEYKMHPVFASFSEYNNILFTKCINTTSSPDDEKRYYRDHLVESKHLDDAVNIQFYNETSESEVKENITNIAVVEDAFGEIKFDMELEICDLNLERVDIVRSVVDRYQLLNTERVYHLPQDTDAHKDKISDYYYVHKDGRQFLGKKHYPTVLQRIKDVNLFETIKKQLNSINFILPQQKEVISENFCNESIYANMSLLYVSGFLRLESAV
jgi:hypothetical protein